MEFAANMLTLIGCILLAGIQPQPTRWIAVTLFVIALALLLLVGISPRW